MNRWFPPRAVWNVLLAAFTLRWVGLDRHSLWLDEGVTWSWATAPGWSDTLFAEANHPPLWWLVSRAWVGFFGDSEASLRAPAALCGVLTVYLGWLLALRLLSPAHAPARGGFSKKDDGGAGARLATWFAAFLAGSTFFIEIAQEARMYALLVAESLGLALLYLRWLDRDDRASLVGFSVVATLALHTHYFAIWPIAALAAHALYLAVSKRRDPDATQRVRLLPFTLANAAAGLLFVPWLVYAATHYQNLALGAPDRPFQRLAYILWRIGAGPALGFVDAERIKQGLGEVLIDEAPLLLAVTALWLPPLVCGVRRLAKTSGSASLVLFAVGLPVLCLLALYPVIPFLHERYIAFVAPWVWFVAAVGAGGAGPRLRKVLLGGLCLLVAGGLVAYHFVDRELAPRGEGAQFGNIVLPREVRAHPDDPTTFLHRGHPYGKEPWREVSTLIHRYAADGDLVVLCPGYLHFVWDYYGRTRTGGPLPVLRLPDLPPEPEALLQEYGDRLAKHRRVFLVVSHALDQQPDHAYRSLYRALARAWGDVEVVPPIPFLRSWSVYVSIFTRR